ncbi:MAG: hypothetical protein IT488_05855 [Gammaproteobacteria bacterium]|nr:hypothetical protein [Gammaproteobacteria bacterium]
MEYYSVDKLIAETRRLAAAYRRTTGRPLAGVGAEICQHDAARLLDLELCQPPVIGYDAVGRGGRAGKRVQIKGRAIFDEGKGGHRIGQLRTDQEWDSVVLVLMDENFEPFEIYEAERAAILDDLDRSESRRSKRGAMSVARFRNLGRLVWERGAGVVEGEVWDNQANA